jgi:hypothetical protein
MIQVDSLLYKIDQKLNKLSTNEHQQIQLEDKILALNEAQLKLIKQKIDNPSSTKHYEDLQKLVENFEDHILPLVEADVNLNKWIASLSGIVPHYMFYVDSYILADKGRCKNRKIWVNKELAGHGDIQFLLNNVHYRPSFEYQETFNFISSDELAIFTDGAFTPNNLYLSYIRYPIYIDKAGYIKLNGTASINQDCELNDYLEDELVDLTVQCLAMYTENTSAVQSAQMRIQTNE